MGFESLNQRIFSTSFMSPKNQNQSQPEGWNCEQQSRSGCGALRSYVSRCSWYPFILDGRDGRAIRQPTRRMQRLCRSEEHTSELQSQFHLVCRLLLEK